MLFLEYACLLFHLLVPVIVSQKIVYGFFCVWYSMITVRLRINHFTHSVINNTLHNNVHSSATFFTSWNFCEFVCVYIVFPLMLLALFSKEHTSYNWTSFSTSS
jgi:hypothetical protein